jgi:hypothetical protein
MQVDVNAAFAAFDDEEPPTTPAPWKIRALAQRPEARDDGVTALAPLDAVPILAVPRAELPWDELGQLAIQLLLRVDGVTRAMRIVTGTGAPPSEGARVLGTLAGRGIVRFAME